MTAQACNRLLLIDLARTAALAGMVAFHFRFDLVFFGLLAPEVTTTAFFYWHARIVAGAFLFLAGLSLWLAHGRGLRWPAFWQRQARLVAAAALVSAATYVAIPEAWIFFGVLHSIALGSLLALPFLRLPTPFILTFGLAILVGSYLLPPLLEWNHPGLRWLGLQTLPTQTMDLEPLFPWFGTLLLGLGAGKLLGPFWAQLNPTPGKTLCALAWVGQHSMAVYLIHQPVLLGLIWAYVQVR
jgi:uncharacterized membrane protein